MFKSLKRSAKGAAVPHEKGTAGMATVTMATPAHVIIPMSMHIGAPAEPVVKKGDQVCVGTLIGKAGGFVSANIYSSVSGTVGGVAPFRMVNGSTCQAVAIAADGQQRIAVEGVVSSPVCLKAVEKKRLTGEALQKAVSEAVEPLADLRGSVSYKRYIAGVVVADLLADCQQMIKEK